ncbi:MAG: hypothetical protein ACRC2K_02305 [Clostridium sp.]
MREYLKKLIIALSIFSICFCTVSIISYSYNLDSPINKDDIKRFKS